MTDINHIDSFLSHLKDNRKTSVNTLSAYQRDLSAFCEFVSHLRKSVVAVTDKDISKFKLHLADDGKSVATISRCMSTLRSFYKFLVVNGYCSSNPAVDIKNDKVEKKFFEVLSEDDVDRLLASPDERDFKGLRDKAMLEILYATGMKVSELMSLNVSDVNLRMQCVNCHGSKTGDKGRMILLYPKAVDALDSYIRKSRSYFVTDPLEEALFVNVNGERMTRQGFWKLLKSYAEQSGISKTITPHTLRHSFATHLLQNGADIHDIKDILGHADISSTQVYSDFIKRKISGSYLKYNHRSK